MLNEKAEIRAGVLLSGRGSNFRAIVQHEQAGYFRKLRVVCVASNKAGAPGLAFAADKDIVCLDKCAADFESLADFEQYIVTEMKRLGVDLLILAGYMRIVGKTLLDAWPCAIVNIHPSLLPSFPGLHAHAQTLRYGVKVSGCTVHFVDAGLDSGPIIGQRTVPMLDTDTEETLSQRILEQEHELYSECLKRITEQAWSIRERTVFFDF